MVDRVHEQMDNRDQLLRHHLQMRRDERLFEARTAKLRLEKDKIDHRLALIGNGEEAAKERASLEQRRELAQTELNQWELKKLRTYKDSGETWLQRNERIKHELTVTDVNLDQEIKSAGPNAASLRSEEVNRRVSIHLRESGTKETRQTRDRMRTVVQFMDEHESTAGNNHRRTADFARGTDLSKELKVYRPGDPNHPLGKGDHIVQRIHPNGPGSYFTYGGVAAERSGISNPKVDYNQSDLSQLAWQSQLERREFQRYQVREQPVVLVGTSASIRDDFTNAGHHVDARGGGDQIYITASDREKLERLPQPDESLNERKHLDREIMQAKRKNLLNKPAMKK